MALEGLSSYKDYLDLMVQYRKNMGELYDSTNPVDKETYWANRELIKQLRYHALTENIDLYSLEYDAKSIIKKEAVNKKILPKEDALAKAKQTALDEDRKAQADIAAGRVPDYSKMQQAQRDIIKLNNELSVLYDERSAGYTPEEQKSYEKYIKEAYLVKEMVDIRERYERATDAEKKILAEQAKQIRLQVNYLYGNEESEVYDFERRVWLMYYGRDISKAPAGSEDAKLWEGHRALMQQARSNYKKMGTEEQKKLDPLKTDAQMFEEKYGDAGRNMWRERKYETFSGSDMVVYFAFPGHRPVDIGTASLISYSVYREKKQVRTIGAINTKGITKGPRTISGRMVFTVVREHIVEMIKRELPYMRAIKNVIMDELPPFDILVSFGNEYGASAGLVIQGVTFVDEQKTLTVDDLFTENIFTYLARDIEVMKNMAASVQDPYDPLEWYTGGFIPMGTEILGNFKPTELQVYRSGEFLSDPAPFYGAAAGWNSDLYDYIYDAPIIEDGGSGDGGSGGTDPEPPPEEKPTPPEDTGTSMDYKSKTDFLWIETSFKEAKSKNMFVAGYSGLRPELSAANRKKLDGSQNTKLKEAHQWSYMGESAIATGPISMKTNVLIDGTNDALWKKVDDNKKWIEDDGNNGSMEIKLKMFNVVKDNYANILDGVHPVGGTVNKEYKVHMTWDYYPPNYGDYDNKSLSVNYTKHDSRKYTEIGVLGFWKRKLLFSDMKKAIQYLWKDTTVGYWTKWASKKLVPANEIIAGQKTNSKNSIIVGGMSDGKYGVNRIWNEKSSNADGAIITIPSGGSKTIDLKKFLYFVSSVAPITGQRYVLDFSDLPKGAIVVCKFSYSLDKPGDPEKGGNRKTFYIKIFRSKVGDGIGNNGYTMNTPNQIAGQMAEAWTECNEKFRKEK